MYNPSRGVPEPRVVPLPQCEVVVRTIPTRAAQGVHSCGVPPQRDSGRHFRSARGEFARRSPPHGRHEFGRNDHNFKS
jgi:hypothetical protein